MSILIKNVDIYVDNEIKTKQNIAIKNNKIKSFPKNPNENDFDEIINGNGMLALPGFINTHTHVAMSLFRSYADDMNLMDWLQTKIWPAEEHLDEDIVYWGSMLSFAEMIRGGTTAFCDMYMFMDACAKAANKIGIRGNLARGLSGLSPNANQALEENIELKKKWNGADNDRFRVMLGPHAPYTCPPEYLKKVCKIAEKEEMPIHIHLSETQTEVKNCISQYKMTPIELMNDIGIFEYPTLAAHCVHLNNSDIEILSKKNVKVAHNPGSNLKLASGIAPITDMMKNNIIIGLGTDGASSNNKLDMYSEIRLAALIHKAKTLNPLSITSQEAIQMATINGAKCLGYDNLGELKEGYFADIQLIERNDFHWKPCFDDISLLVYAGNSLDVNTVIIHGKIVMKNKQLITIDTERLNYEVSRVTKKLYSFNS